MLKKYIQTIFTLIMLLVKSVFCLKYNKYYNKPIFLYINTNFNRSRCQDTFK